MTKSPFNKIILIIIIALLVPIITYTTFQFTEIDKNEQLIRSIYDRQLESILLSANQYCWDFFNTWLSEVTSIAVVDFDNFLTLYYRSKLHDFVDNQQVIAGAFFRFSPDYFITAWENRSVESLPNRRRFKQNINDIVQKNSDVIKRYTKLAKDGYVRPYAQSWPSEENQQYTLLLFPILNEIFPEDGAILGGLFIDNTIFVEEVVARRISSMTEGEFEFAVKRKDQQEFLYYSNEEYPEEKFENSAALWIMPDMIIQIKMTGTTLEKVSSERVKTNLVLLIVVNVVFMLGLVYLIKSVSKEIDLAKMKTSFVANVSHELRTPLALIRMYAETLEMGRLRGEAKKQKYYRTILTESARLTQLINNILDFSRIESKKKEYHFINSDLHEIVRKAVELYRYHIELKGFTLEEEIDHSIPLIPLDGEAVIQAIVNLLDNAIKYSFEEKYIKISVSQQNSNIILSVQDKGMGIQDSEQKKIFDKFYRIGSSLVHNTKGSGLGLSLVKYIMDAHKGQIQVKSKYGKGSTFSLIFPLTTQLGE